MRFRHLFFADRTASGVFPLVCFSYAIGGHDGTNHLSSAECFDPATNMWHAVASMDTRRRGIAVGALEGAIYAVGGLDDTACFQVYFHFSLVVSFSNLLQFMNSLLLS